MSLVTQEIPSVCFNNSRGEYRAVCETPQVGIGKIVHQVEMLFAKTAYHLIGAAKRTGFFVMAAVKSRQTKKRKPIDRCRYNTPEFSAHLRAVAKEAAASVEYQQEVQAWQSTVADGLGASEKT